MGTQKNEAERLRIAVEGGWVPIADVVAWADRQIEEAPQPHPSLVDLALAHNRTREEVASLLDAVPGSVDRVEVMRSCLSDLRGVVGRTPWLAADVASWIESSAHRGELSEADFGSEPLALADVFALAQQGIYGTVGGERPTHRISRAARDAQGLSTACGRRWRTTTNSRRTAT
jgi:hypothetical protein